MSDGKVENYGFKQLTENNWREADPIWCAISGRNFGAISAEEWFRDVQCAQLNQGVPIEIRKMYEVARGAILYGWYFYPLLTLGDEQLFRVMDAAVSQKAKQSGYIADKPNFRNAIEWLISRKILNASDGERWVIATKIRNIASHPQMQTIQHPSGALATLHMVVDLVDKLFFGESP